MADSAVAVTAGSGTNVDTRTEATNGNHRQVIVIGDPATNAGVAPVDVDSGLYVLAAGRTVVVGTEFTRPANATAFAIKDVVGDSTAVPTLTNVARLADGSGLITRVKVFTDFESTVGPVLRVHFYNASPTLVNDNAVFPALYANKSSWQGSVDLPALAGEDASGDCYRALAVPGISNLPLPFVCAGGSRNLYYVVETLDAFTPSSGQKVYVEIAVEAN